MFCNQCHTLYRGNMSICWRGKVAPLPLFYTSFQIKNMQLLIVRDYVLILFELCYELHMIFNLKDAFSTQESQVSMWLLIYDSQTLFLFNAHCNWDVISTSSQNGQTLLSEQTFTFFCAKVTFMLVLMMHIVQDDTVSHKTKWFFTIFTTNCDFFTLNKISFKLNCAVNWWYL